MVRINDVTSYTHIDGVGVIVLNSPPVNALSAAVRDGIHAGVRQAIADAHASAIVLRCDGNTFIAGADIREFGKPPAGGGLGEVQRALEESPKPVVAAKHGPAPGGGLEAALVGSRARGTCRQRGWSRRCTARRWGAGWRWRWSATGASPCRARNWACPRSASACCPAPVARSGCRASWGPRWRSN